MISDNAVTFSDGSVLEYGQGRFDGWCVFLTDPDGVRYAPRDHQYFGRLSAVAARYGAQTVYGDFVAIYQKATERFDKDVLELITSLSEKYDDSAVAMAVDFTILYMGLVAEENKANTRLGKRVKRLGVYQVLMENMSPDAAANYSKGKTWRALDALCASYGF